MENPLTPLGARTHLSHPALVKVVAGLSVVIIIGAYLVFADYTGHWPYAPALSPLPTASALPIAIPEGWKQYTNALYGFSFWYPESFGTIGSDTSNAAIYIEIRRGSLDGYLYDNGPNGIVTRYDAASGTWVAVSPGSSGEPTLEKAPSGTTWYAGGTGDAGFAVQWAIVPSPRSDYTVTIGVVGSSNCYTESPCVTPLPEQVHGAETLQAIVGTMDFGATTARTVEYRNPDYGLSVTLPASWEEFTVTKNTHSQQGLGTWYEFVFRHPKWTTDHPYEDLPIMVFSPVQWGMIQDPQQNIAVSAAPFPPSRLAGNEFYVFGLPPRYNYDYSEGFQELDDVVHSGAVQAFEPTIKQISP